MVGPPSGTVGLQRIRSDLQDRLARIPPDVDLARVIDADIESVARLFSVLDERRVLGVRGTTLSKVIHRKRPRLVPLHDQHVRAAYVPTPVPALDPVPGATTSRC